MRASMSGPVEMQSTSQTSSEAVRWVAKWLLVCVAVATLLMHAAPPTDAASGSGSWIDSTTYCGSGVCTVLTAYHRSNVSFKWYRSSTGAKVAYDQSFGGVTGQDNNLCNPAWKKANSTYYSHRDGNTTISGWRSTGAWCNTYEHCDSFWSDYSYWLYGTTAGHFGSFTYWTTRCSPASGRQHYVNVAF